jgi:hypothetical protein
MAHLAACVDAALEGRELPSEPHEMPVEASAVPEVKVTAPDGSTVQAAGKSTPASRPGPQGKGSEEELRNTKVGVPSNTVSPQKGPDSGAKKDQHKADPGKKAAAAR